MTQEKDEVFEDLSYKWNVQAGMFTSKSYEVRQKCSSMKRVAFLVYCGQETDYEDKLENLLKKMTEGFKYANKDNELIIQLFLLFRVLLLRLKTQSLTEALRKVWPHLLNELVGVFEEPKQDIRLAMEAVKIIDLMSCLNIEDFHLNQWIFLVDAYGMKLDPTYDPSSKGKVALQPENVFQPFIIKFMDRQKMTFYNQVVPPNKPEGKLLRSVSIQVSPPVYEEDVLNKYAVGFQHLVTMSNMDRTQLDRERSETEIEKDFIEHS